MTFRSVAVWRRWCSGCRRARPPARLGGLTSFGAAPRSPPVPSGPSGALHTSDAVSLCVAERVVSKPGQAPPPPTSTAARPAFTPQASRQALAPLTPVPTPNFACNSPTTTSNIEFRSLELQRFQSLLKLLPIELRASFRRQRRATTHRHRSGAHLHAAVRPRKREKILPARAKHPKISTFSPAGRILSRSDL